MGQNRKFMILGVIIVAAAIATTGIFISVRKSNQKKSADSRSEENTSITNAPIEPSSAEVIARFSECISSMGLSLTWPNQTAVYNRERFAHNHRVNVFPIVIVQAESTMEVSDTMKCAAAGNIRVCARSGSHSFAAQSVCDGGVVLDVSRINHFQYDQTTQQATAGPGILLGQLYYRLWTADRRSVPAGTCPTVGLGGHVLGGGFGVLGRRHGFLSDNVVEMELVLPSGEIRTLSGGDLFWATLGGGGNQFGVATSFTMRTFPADDVVQFALRWPRSQMAAVLQRYSEWSYSAPDQLFLMLQLVKDTDWVAIHGVLHGEAATEAEARRLLEPSEFLATSGEFSNRNYEQFTAQSWIDAVLELGVLYGVEPSVLEFVEYGVSPTTGQRNEALFNWNAHSTFLYDALSPEASQAISTSIDKPGRASGPVWTTYMLVGTYGGQFGQRPSDASPFPHRAARMYTEMMTYWPTGDEGSSAQHAGLEFIDEVYQTVRSAGGARGAYVNYADDSLPATSFATEYYGDNLQRLMQVRSQVESASVLRFDQSIPIAQA